MARENMDVLELLRKRSLDGDVDLLREALGVLVEGIMDAEVSANLCKRSTLSVLMPTIRASVNSN